MVPARIWPDYECAERGGTGWEVTIEQADKRTRAVLLSFVEARHANGARYAKEWLEFSTLEAI